MLTVISGVALQHDISLVVLATVLCVFGSWVTARLYRHARERSLRHALTWNALTALTAGITIWCTHFVAMLGYHPDTEVDFNVMLTFVSFLIAVGGSAAGIFLSKTTRIRFAPATGGAVVGLAITGMHYAGMNAYRVQGIVTWNLSYLVASIILATVFASVALVFGHKAKRYGEYLMMGTLTFAIVSVHFVGMAAFKVEVADVPGDFTNPEGFKVFALFIAGTAIIMVLGALLSYAIENRTFTENIAELTEARNAAESASRAKSEFLSILSHELRTPLSVIIGYAAILAKLKEVNARKAPSTDTVVNLSDSRLGDQAELYGEKISVAAGHLLKMINEILDYTSLELGDIKLDRRSFPVRALLDKVQDQFSILAAEKSVTIKVDSEDVIAFADHQRCLQILINLVGNALKFSKADEIILRSYVTKDGFNIEVQDNGCGIPQEAQALIFNAFQQIEPPDNRLEGGTGLGLAMCKTLAVAHGAELTVQSRPGAGATFIIAMPQSAIDPPQLKATA